MRIIERDHHEYRISKRGNKYRSRGIDYDVSVCFRDGNVVKLSMCATSILIDHRQSSCQSSLLQNDENFRGILYTFPRDSNFLIKGIGEES